MKNEILYNPPNLFLRGKTSLLAFFKFRISFCISAFSEFNSNFITFCNIFTDNGQKFMISSKMFVSLCAWFRDQEKFSSAYFFLSRNSRNFPHPPCLCYIIDQEQTERKKCWELRRRSQTDKMDGQNSQVHKSLEYPERRRDDLIPDSNLACKTRQRNERNPRLFFPFLSANHHFFPAF